MNTEIIVKTARATLDGTMSFPEVVGQLLAAGVEYYHVDHVGMRKTFYSADGDLVVTPTDSSRLGSGEKDFAEQKAEGRGCGRSRAHSIG